MLHVNCWKKTRQRAAPTVTAGDCLRPLRPRSTHCLCGGSTVQSSRSNNSCNDERAAAVASGPAISSTGIRTLPLVLTSRHKVLPTASRYQIDSKLSPKVRIFQEYKTRGAIPSGFGEAEQGSFEQPFRHLPALVERYEFGSLLVHP